jgi:hypothetical protein
MRKRMRKAQASGATAAVFVAVLALLMVLYILFLPPEDREAILGSGSKVTTPQEDDPLSRIIYNETVLAKSPGRLDYLKFDEYEHDLPAINLYKTTSANEILIESAFVIRNGWFDNQKKKINFNVRDISNMKDFIMSFENKIHNGRLKVTLNGEVILEDYVDSYNVGPINMPVDLIGQTNTLEFEVSEVGWKFWTTNEYNIKNLKIVADITDVSKDTGKSVFYASYEEIKNMESGYIRFNPNCNSEAGYLSIMFNAREIYNALPDCGILNKVEVPVGYFSSGENEVIFKTEKGSYLIDQIQVKTTLNEPNNPVYMFELEDSLFREKFSKPKAECGKIDGICPEGCDDNDDKDCCFTKNTGAFWCDVKTDDGDDRCVKFMDEEKCYKCPSGYEDIKGNPHKYCEGLCGDDTDKLCPSGCSRHYDSDCCYNDYENESTNYYFCPDLPTTGADYICLASVRVSQCLTCETGYEDESGSKPEVCAGAAPAYDEEIVLRDGFHVNLTIDFVDDVKSKNLKVLINSRTIWVHTKDVQYSRIIDSYVEPGTNSIKLIPESTMDIRQVKVLLKD